MRLDDLAQEPFISLTTFKRDGTPVSRPVWVAGEDGRLLVLSNAETWKVKRIRHDSHVRVAPCGATGRVHGQALEGRARILSDHSRVQALEERKYGLQYRLTRLFKGIGNTVRRRSAPEEVMIEIAPASPVQVEERRVGVDGHLSDDESLQAPEAPGSRLPERLGRGAGVLVLTAVYWFAVRRWFSRWGTTGEELLRTMPGDALISDPTDMSMQSVTVNAPPEEIWPWLAQIGYQRGGLYSYDRLDRLFGFLDRPSAIRILPEFQKLAVGDKIPWGHDTEMTVGVAEPPRALALSYETDGFKWVWQFGLYPLDEQRTRFVTRGTEHVPKTRLWWLAMRIMEPASFIMTRRFLLGVKQRAEAMHAP